MERVRRERQSRAPERMWGDRPVRDVVLQRRRQMLVHSYLYYVRDQPIVSDHQWQAWADELTAIQGKHGHTFGFYDTVFADWNGSSGYHLPQDAWVMDKALRLLRYEDGLRQPTATDQPPARVRRTRTVHTTETHARVRRIRPA